MSTVKTKSIQYRFSNGGIQIGGDTIIRGLSQSSFRGPGKLIQKVTFSDIPTSHIGGASQTTTEYDFPLMSAITPTSATSEIRVKFHTGMSYATNATSAIIFKLYRRIDGGSWTELTPATGGDSRFRFGWMYHIESWSPIECLYSDLPQTTGLVEYKTTYRNWAATTTSYFQHLGQEYGWTLEEHGV